MTDEQIKQNADEYALKRTLVSTDSFHGMVENYLAGAHSRDEEIKELNNLLEARRESLFQSTKRITELEMENNQLHNPWISVEERLPEKIKNKGVSKYVFVTWPDGTRGEAYYNYEEYKAPRWEIKGAGIMEPEYWMPIPKLKEK